MPDPIVRPLLQRMRRDFGCDCAPPWAPGNLTPFIAIHHEPNDDTMPTPDYKPPEFDTDRRRALLEHQMTAAFTGRPTATLDDVLSAVTILTDEVRRLRDAIEPPPSALILGPAALADFARIKAGRP